jgi:hypothetical protein
VRLEIIGVHHIAVKHSAGAEYGVHDVGLPHAHLVGHPAYQSIAADSHGGITGEIKVVQGIKCVIFVLQESSKRIDLCGKSFDKHFCKPVGRHVKKQTVIIRNIFAYAYPLEQTGTGFPVIEYFHQKLIDQIHVSHFGKHTMQLAVFLAGYGEIKDVAVEGPLDISWSHVFHFRSGRMQKNGLKTAYLGVYVYPYFILCHRVKVLLPTNL